METVLMVPGSDSQTARVAAGRGRMIVALAVLVLAGPVAALIVLVAAGALAATSRTR